jgi:hypothetical protein
MFEVVLVEMVVGISTLRLEAVERVDELVLI